MTTLVEEVKSMRQEISDLRKENEELRTRLAVAESVASEVKGLRKAAYWVGGLIIAGAISFGFSVLALVPG